MSTIQQQLKEAITPQVNEVTNDVELLAKDIAILIGSKLSPAEFYEYLHDYSQMRSYLDRHGFDADEIEKLEDAFAEIEQQGLTNNHQPNTSAVKATELYKAYIKY